MRDREARGTGNEHEERRMEMSDRTTLTQDNIRFKIPGLRGWEEGIGGRRRNQVTEGIQLEDLFSGIKEFFIGGKTDALGALSGAEAGQDTGGLLGELRGIIDSLFGLNGEDSTITTKLQIESTTNTIVQLDGQVIANAIKPYLLNDEVRYEGTAGSAVKRFII
jgi:hypothetical protein